MKCRIVCISVSTLVLCSWLAQAHEESALRLEDENTAWSSALTPDVAGNGFRPNPHIIFRRLNPKPARLFPPRINLPALSPAGSFT
ncbi:MAG: hypothetical protein WDM76_01025 [Limisphaerales bacterium]